ncbi:unnamed protein product [Notodromas monacha]|uniref:Transmembrane protein n=1 Tax=Notodromas monacha TaxID=399045 RepID=A0A7R9BPS3_9CRUS|nr:unnamed protein product [Notodromas monacha]CAG0919392.1 unnamed protein product [Notodromas monacha]
MSPQNSTKQQTASNKPVADGGGGGVTMSEENKKSLLKFLVIFAVALLVTATVTCTAMWLMSPSESGVDRPDLSGLTPSASYNSAFLQKDDVDRLREQEMKKLEELARTEKTRSRESGFERRPAVAREEKEEEDEQEQGLQNPAEPMVPVFPSSSSSSSGGPAGTDVHDGFLSAILQLANLPPPTGGIFSAAGGPSSEGHGTHDGSDKKREGLQIPSLASLFSAGMNGDAFAQLFGNFTSSSPGSSPGSDENPADLTAAASAPSEGQDDPDSAPGTVEDPGFRQQENNPDPGLIASSTNKKRVKSPSSSQQQQQKMRRSQRLKFRFRGPLAFLTVFSFSAFIVELLNHALGVRPGGSQLGQNVVRAFSAGEDSKWRQFEEPGDAALAYLPPVDYANSLTRALLSLVKAWQGGGEFYECAWKLFCEDLNESLDVPGTPGALARINRSDDVDRLREQEMKKLEELARTEKTRSRESGFERRPAVAREEKEEEDEQEQGLQNPAEPMVPVFPSSSSSSSGGPAGTDVHDGFLSAILQLANLPPPTGGIFSAAGGPSSEGHGTHDGSDKKREGLQIPSLASLFSAGMNGDAFAQLFGNFTSSSPGSSPGSDENPADLTAAASAPSEGQDDPDSAPGTVEDPGFRQQENNPDPGLIASSTNKKRVKSPSSSQQQQQKMRRSQRLKFRFRGPLAFLTVFSFSAFIVELLNHALGVRPGGSQLGQNVVRAFSAGEDSKWRQFEEPGDAALAYLPPVDYANSLTRALLSLVKAWQGGGEFYECAWKLFCEDLNESLDVPGTPGALARINSVGLRVGFGSLRHRDMPVALMRSFIGEKKPMKCGRLFHGYV